MVERVARVICHMHGSRMCGPGQSIATRELGWKPDGGHNVAYVALHWREHEQAAIAAIEAMREPTEAMLEAVQSALDNPPPSGSISKIAWQAMIDEALK